MPAKPTAIVVTDKMVADFIIARIKENVGAGKRFADSDTFKKTLAAASKQFNTHIGDPPRNREETALIAGTLALSSEHCFEFNRLARLALVPKVGNLQADALFDIRVSGITAWNVQKYTTQYISDHKLEPTPDAPSPKGEKVPDTPAAGKVVPKPKEPGSKPSLKIAEPKRPIKPAAKIEPKPKASAHRIAVSPSIPKPTRPTPVTKPAIVKKPEPVEAQPLKLEYALLEGNCADALLENAIENHHNIAQVLSDGLERLRDKCKRHVSQAEFAELLGVTPAQYGKFARNEHSAPPTELMDKLSGKMGAETDAQKKEWRKFILGIPAYRNQNMLNICFDPNAKWTPPKNQRDATRTIIDPEATTGDERKAGTQAFFKLLQDRDGYSNLGQVAAAIMPNPLKDGYSSVDLQKVILQLTSGNALRINPEHAEAIAAVARYAFPDKGQESLREACVGFLSSDKYLKPIEPHTKEFRGLTYPYGQKGRGLLQSYVDKKKKFGDLLSDMYALSRGSQDVFSEKLGIATSQYRLWVSGEHPQAFELSDINALAKTMGAESENDVILWRQFMLGIPQDYNQGMVNSCFERSIANEPTGDIKRITADPDKFNEDRPAELKKFFDLLKKRFGVLNNIQLADVILTTQKNTKYTAEQLASQINNSMQAQKRMMPEFSAIIAKSAFTSERERDACIEFLSSEKYLPSNDPTKPPPEPDKLVFPQGKTGKELLQYARDHKLTFGELLEDIRNSSALSKTVCATLLNIDAGTYRRLIDKESTEDFAFQTYDTLAVTMGATNEHEKAEWRRFIRGVPAEVNQALVDGCFEKDSPRFIDTEATGKARSAALARFFHLLMQQSGCRAVEPLANVIVTYANQPDFLNRVNYYIKTTSKGTDITTEVVPHNDGNLEPIAGDLPKVMTAATATLIANYAFPDHRDDKGAMVDNAARRAQCVDFLSAEKYLDPELPEAPKILRFPEDKTGNDLLKYAYENKLTFAKLLAEIRSLSGMFMTEFGPAMGLTHHRYSDFEADKCRNITEGEYRTLAEKLGAKTPDEYLEWRKFIAGIPKDITQDILNHCFDPDSKYKIDTEAAGPERGAAARKFIELVAHRHGFDNWMSLSRKVTEQAKLGSNVNDQLNACLHKLASADGTTQGSRAIPALPRHYGRLFADFAFPDATAADGTTVDNSALREKCFDFLSSNKHRRNKTERYKTAGEAISKAHQERRERLLHKDESSTGPENNTGIEL